MPFARIALTGAAVALALGCAAPLAAATPAAPGGTVTVANYCDGLKAKEQSARQLAAVYKAKGDAKNYRRYIELAAEYHAQYEACIRT